VSVTYRHEPMHLPPYYCAYAAGLIARPIVGLGSVNGSNALQDARASAPPGALLIAVPCSVELRNHVMAFGGGAVRWRLRLDGVADLCLEEDDLCTVSE
jgi:hypothetical protein